MRTLATLAVLVAVSVATAADEKPDYDKLKAKWAETVKAEAKAEQDSLDAQIKKAGKNKAEVARLQKLKADYAKRNYAMRPTDLKVGDFGKLGANYLDNEPPIFTVDEVLSKTEAIMQWGEKTFLVEVDTKGWTDDDKVKITDYVHATDTKKVRGKTVLVLKVVK